ncbi:structural protein [Pseudoalteromonas phage PS_L5]|nr:structural protein [Pseudoalteromonas phage PS_L5]
MNLVGYTATALSRNDIEDTPTNKNVVDFAIVELKDLQGNLVVMYDDAEGLNPETQKICDTNGQVTFFAEIGDYNLEINGKAQRINLAANIADYIKLGTGESVQEFADSFALKIFQSPTDGGLTEIQTRTVSADEVYEVRKTSDDSLATIYSDSTGTTEIVQNGTDNKSGGDGVVEFYVADGDYYITVNSVRSDFSTSLETEFDTVQEAVEYKGIRSLLGKSIKTKEYHTGTGYGGASYDVVDSSSVTPNGIDVILSDADSGVAFKLYYVFWLDLTSLGFKYDSTGQDYILERARDLTENTGTELRLGNGNVCLDGQITFEKQMFIKGNYSKGETVIKTSIKKNEGFSDNSLIQVGDGVNGVQGFHVEGVYINGNSQTGNGFSTTKTANCTLRDFQVEYNLGVGMDIDGQWISNWYNVGVRYNGGGGLFFRGDNRESSDVRIFGFVCNNNSLFQLKMDHVKAADFYSPLIELPDDDSPLLIIEEADRCNFYGGQIAQQINKDSACVILGNSTNIATNIKFNGTYFQQNPLNTNLHAVLLDNCEAIDFIGCFNQGSGKFINAPTTATSINKILIVGGNYLRRDITDPSNLLTIIGTDNYELGDVNSDGILHIRNNEKGKRLDLDVRNGSGSVKSLFLGSGSDFDEVDFATMSARLRPRSAAPSSPQIGRIEMADGTSWDPLSLGGGSYIVWYSSGGWQPFSKTSSGTLIS